MNKLVIVLASGLLVFGLAACNPEQPENELGAPPASEQETPPVNERETSPDEGESPAEEKDSDIEVDPNQPVGQRPAVKQDTILIEGMEETFSFNLVETEGLGFSTYVIEDMIAEQSSSADGDELFVYVNFGGVKNEQAGLRIFSPKKESKVEMEQLITDMKEELASMGLQMKETTLDSHHPFTAPDSPVHVEKVYLLTSNDLGGRAIFFEHDQRPYVLYYHYPHEYGDGFDPRINKLIADLVWLRSS